MTPAAVNPGLAYLRSRGIALSALPASVEWVPSDKLGSTDTFRADGGERKQHVRPKWLPDDAAGALRFTWKTLDGERRYEHEAVTAAGRHVDCLGRSEGRVERVKRHAEAGPGIGGAHFKPIPPRQPHSGDVLHVTEGALDGLSLVALGHVEDGDDVIAVHGCHGLAHPSTVWLCRRYERVVIWPHHLDKSDAIGERKADELAAALAGRCDVEVVRSDHPRPHDLNDELTGKAPRRAGPEQGAGVVMDGAEWVRQQLRPPVEELVPDAPGLAYRGRMSIFHADRGTGKTLYAVWMVVQALRAGMTVMVAADDDRETWATLLRQFDAPLDKFLPIEMAAAAPPGRLESAVETYRPALLVVDSWRRWAGASGATRKPGGLNDEAIAGAIADRLVNVATSGPAAVLLANQAKGEDGVTMRGSAAPEDAVTGAIRTARRVPGSNTTVIKTAGKTRHGVPDGVWAFTFGPEGFSPTDPPASGDDHGAGDVPRVSTDDVHAVLNGQPMTVNAIARAVFDTKRPNQKQRRGVQNALNAGVDTGQFETSKVAIRGREWAGYTLVNRTNDSERQRTTADDPEHPPDHPPASSDPVGTLLADAPGDGTGNEHPPETPADAERERR